MDTQPNHDDNETMFVSQTIKKIEHYFFKWTNKIGKGNFSDVYLGLNEQNQEQVAIKVIKNQLIKSKTAQRILNHEIKILKHLNHPNVIHCYDVISSLNNCYIITQYCEGGDLDKILKDKQILQQSQIYKIAYDVYKGLQYLNQNIILHRDIKIANIFLKNDSYKIADFGFSIRAKNLFTDIPIGSPIYMSPQGLINNLYGPKTDVWSFGILLYQLLHGYAPLDNCKTQDQLKTSILKKPAFKNTLSSEIVCLINRCLEVNIQKRISIAQIRQTQFMQKVFGLYGSSSSIGDKLSQTFYSTQTSNSIIENIFNRDFSYDQALSIIHYTRLLHKCSIKTESKAFAQGLLLIYDGFINCKIIKVSQHQQNETKISKKDQYKNIKQIISEYSQKYTSVYNCIKCQNILANVIIDYLLGQCSKLYKLYQNQDNLNYLKDLVFSLYKETQLLKQSFKDNKMDYFAKHSKAKQFLVQIKNAHLSTQK